MTLCPYCNSRLRIAAHTGYEFCPKGCAELEQQQAQAEIEAIVRDANTKVDVDDESEETE